MKFNLWKIIVEMTKSGARFKYSIPSINMLMADINAELITRINKDLWIRLLMNGGCNLVATKPKYDNQFKATLISEEGVLNLLFTENNHDDASKKFVDASVNFRCQNKDILIRVDNQSIKQFHFHVIENKNKLEDHTLLIYKNEPPLRFAIKQVIEIFKNRYSGLVKNWQIFNMPSLTFLSEMLIFTPKVDGIINFPVCFVVYPGYNITMQIYSRKPQIGRLIPAGFIIEKRR